MSALETAFDALQSILATAAIALAAWGLGRSAWRWLRGADSDALSEFIWSQVLGLVIAASTLLGLALLGVLHEFTVAALTLAGILSAAVEIACILAGAKGLTAASSGHSEVPPPRVGRAAAFSGTLLAGVALSIGTISALAPPAAHQVLSTSLDAPKNLLVNRGFSAPQPGLFAEPRGSNLAEMWSLWALALNGPVAANLLHVYLAALLAAATVMLARPLLGTADAWFAGCLVLLAPGVQQQLGVPLPAIPLALVVALAAGGAMSACRQLEGRRRDAVAAGLMLGAAAAIDPLGLWLAGGILACSCLAVQWGPHTPGAAPRLLVQMTWPMALVVTLWLWARSEPVTVPAGSNAAELLAMLGPVLAIALGGLAFARRLHGLNRLLMMLLGLAVLIILLPLGPAAWASLVPLCAAAAAWGWCEVQRLPRVARGGVALLVLVLATWDLAAMFTSNVPRLAVAAGRRPREAFLRDHSGSYRAASVLNQICREGQRLLSQDTENLYFACPTTRAASPIDQASRRDSASLAGSQSDFHRLLERARREGYAYLLLVEPLVAAGTLASRSPDSVSAETHQNLASGEILDSNGEVIPILEYCYADDNNRSIRYRLLKLQGPQADPRRVIPVAEAAGADSAGRLPRLPTR